MLYNIGKCGGCLRPQSTKYPQILTNVIISFIVIVLIKPKYWPINKIIFLSNARETEREREREREREMLCLQNFSIQILSGKLLFAVIGELKKYNQ